MSGRIEQIALAGPLPPPFGGMANQTRQLAELLRASGIGVQLIRSNSPYRPAWAGRIRGLRALFRLFPYLTAAWRGLGKVQLVHLMANSGWSWHLFAAPIIWLAQIRNVPVIVNYRGGEAEAFLKKQIHWLRPTLRRVDQLVVPSGFLKEVFARFGIDAEVVPNIIDLDHFSGSKKERPVSDAPHLVVCRNLELIYDVETAIRAFSLVHRHYPAAKLTIAGEGPERAALEQLVDSLQIKSSVTFSGRLDRDEMVTLYRSADLMLNSSQVDNMPNALLESMSAGVPVVTTDAGGIPHMVRDGISALVRPVGDYEGMAQAAIELLSDHDRYRQLVHNAREEVSRYRWESVKPQWLALYTRTIDGRLATESRKQAE